MRNQSKDVYFNGKWISLVTVFPKPGIWAIKALRIYGGQGEELLLGSLFPRFHNMKCHAFSPPVFSATFSPTYTLVMLVMKAKWSFHVQIQCTTEYWGATTGEGTNLCTSACGLSKE